MKISRDYFLETRRGSLVVEIKVLVPLCVEELAGILRQKEIVGSQ